MPLVTSGEGASPDPFLRDLLQSVSGHLERSDLVEGSVSLGDPVIQAIFQKLEDLAEVGEAQDK